MPYLCAVKTRHTHIRRDNQQFVCFSHSKMNPIPIINPTSLTLITTNQCTAACRNCCLNCNPKGTNRLSLVQMKRYVDTAIQSFPNISHVVLTGGECFLLGDDLADIIQYIHSKKLSSRVVTNGYWASSKESAKKILSGLKALGLSEEILVQGMNIKSLFTLKK